MCLRRQCEGLSQFSSRERTGQLGFRHPGATWQAAFASHLVEFALGGASAVVLTGAFRGLGLSLFSFTGHVDLAQAFGDRLSGVLRLSIWRRFQLAFLERVHHHRNSLPPCMGRPG